MSAMSFRCPRCKTPFIGSDVEQMADDVISHLDTEHGHAPPREHVLARILRQRDRNDDAGTAH